MNSSNGARRENTQKQGLLCVCPQIHRKIFTINLYRDEKAIYKNIIRRVIAHWSIYSFKRVREGKRKQKSVEKHGMEIGKLCRCGKQHE